MKIVIIGNGVAGMEAALTIREREPDWSVTIISEESDHFFSRTALMYIACGQLRHVDTEPHERDVYKRLGFQRVRARATGIDVTAKRVQIAEGEDVPYDRLLIACGSQPRSGPWPGSDLLGVGHFVTHQDLDWLERELFGGASRGGPPPRPREHLAHTTDESPYRFRDAAAEKVGALATQPAVIGGGLIGIECIEVMLAKKLKPKFFIREDWFWPMAIDKQESAYISERMRHHGVDVLLEHDVERIEGEGRVQRVITDEGTYEVDALVIAIGVTPNTDWLGDTLELNRGAIVVDRAFRTSADGVFAAGDCASVEWFNGVHRAEQLWYTARDHGRLAARALLGDDVSYRRGTFYNSAKLMDIEYTTAGLVNWNVEGEENFTYEEHGKVRSTTRIVTADGAVIGFNMLGRRWDHEVLVRFIDERRSLDYVLAHLHEASFDTEFVPPLRIDRGKLEATGPRDNRRAPIANPYKPKPRDAAQTQPRSA